MHMRIVRPFALVLIFLLLLSGAAQAAPGGPGGVQPASAVAHYVTNIVFSPAPPNILANGQNVNLTFNYSTSHPAGVRIFARPMTHGKLSPNYAASSSPLYAAGSGSGTGSFTITSDEVTVDQVLFQIVADDTSAVLQQIFLPVFFQFTSLANRVTNIRLNPHTPNLLGSTQDVNITFDYNITATSGALIFARPMSGGILSPGYDASASVLYTGSGTNTNFFDITLTTHDVTVDAIRFEITNPTQTIQLATFFLPVSYYVCGCSSHVTSVVLSPPSPNWLPNGSNVTVTFTAISASPDGALIFARPTTRGGLSPDYSASSSPTYPFGSNPGSGTFTILGRDVLVDGIRFQITNLDQTQNLFAKTIPVHYQFGQNAFATFLPFIKR